MNIDFKNIKSVYFLGIGGIGMSALARYFKRMGKQVAGYDKTETPLTIELVQEGIPVHYEENISQLPTEFKNVKNINELLVVHTPAVPVSHSEYVHLKQGGFNIIKRAKALGLITEHFRTIAVAGTHGKTTTSSIVTHVLKTGNVDCSAFLGGITKNYNTNILLSADLTSSSQPDPPKADRNPKPTSDLASVGKLETFNFKQETFVVVEADEYDRSFLTLYPYISAITSMDPDHLDIYGDADSMVESYKQFASQTSKEGTLIINEKLKKHFAGSKQNILSYGMGGGADVTPVNIQLEGIYYRYDVKTPSGIIKDITLGIPGFHNIENSLVAITVAHLLGIPNDLLKKGLESFKGVQRRFDIQVENDKLTYIDDYAHHPEEINAFVRSVKNIFSEKKITGIFQPHLYSRTKDFADEFASSLSLLDDVILLDIYPARELPIPGVTSEWLLGKIKSKSKMLATKNNLLEVIEKKRPEVLLTIGAGDIDTMVKPIREMLMKN